MGRLTTSEVNKRLRGRSIELTSKYTHSKDRGTFRCLACGNTWNTFVNNTLQGHGCPRCVVRRPKTERKEIDRRMKKHNLCLLGEYKGDRGTHRFECLTCNFKWNRKGLPGGCPMCKKAGRAYHQHFLKLMKKDLKNRRIVLKGKYNSASLQEVSCLKCEHIWKVRLILGKVVCPKCHPHKFGASEEVVRSIIERVTGWKFPKAKPSDVPWTGGLYLDGYNRRHQVAFEHQGYQHYTWNSYFHGRTTKERKRNFAILKKRDVRKRFQCKYHDVVLLCVPYWKTPKEVEDMVRERLRLS